MVKILSSKISEQTTSAEPGSFLGKSKEGLNFAAGQGSVITILKVKPEGKKEMSARDWFNGAQLKAGDKFLQKGAVKCTPER